MNEHGMPDGRRTKRTKGVHHSLPPGYQIAPDPRHHKSKHAAPEPVVDPTPEPVEDPAAHNPLVDEDEES